MSFLDFLNSLFGRKPSPPNPPTGGSASGHANLPDNNNEPAQITSPKVLLLIYNPTMDAATGKKLSETMNWANPDDLANGFIGDILMVSNGLVRYQIAQRIEVDEFPLLADGFRYTPQTYTNVMQRNAPAHTPTGADYKSILSRFNILQRIAGNEFDEVWIMGFPYAGLYESVMAGRDAFWCNAPPLPGTDSCPRRFVIMGFSYERHIGEMLHSYNHRCESIMAKVFDCQNFVNWAYHRNRTPATVAPNADLNSFQRFILFDQIAPGKAAVGTIHYAPNSTKDYELGNQTPVQSDCYDWLNFPNFKGDVRTVSADEWGGGGERLYQRWWLQHLPKVAGRKDGVHNNWWQYIANPNEVNV